MGVRAGRDPVPGRRSRAAVAVAGGADAVVVREFDLVERRFVYGGFTIDEPGHHTVGWIDRDTVYVSWDRGEAHATAAGYPYEARRWVRGTALADAPVVFRGEPDDISAGAGFDPIDNRHVGGAASISSTHMRTA